MKIYELPNALFDDKPATYIGETDQKIDVGGLVKFNNKYYNCCRVNLKENSLYVRFLDYYLPGMDEDYCNDNLRCPFCGYEERNSFELSDELVLVILIEVKKKKWCYIISIFYLRSKLNI